VYSRIGIIWARVLYEEYTIVEISKSLFDELGNKKRNVIL